ncbi:YciI family protein [Chitinophaga vietnamensis]|uniref:YciI family protein n=1 Tax=Chitinophaga vietnamensis TaxID=2593957 RepID=UPI00117775CA|nr:YciI family protein [Chitinophaga vietnamensis]
MYYYYKLIPPRPTFHTDITAAEQEIMNQHIAYWGSLTEQRTAIVFGPVFDPSGVFGIGIIEVSTPEEARQVPEQDPAIRSGTFKYELFPMEIGFIR